MNHESGLPDLQAERIKDLRRRKPDGESHSGESALRWMREFLRGLTHELSGPLTPLSGHLELLMSQGIEEFNPMQKRCLEAAVRSVARLKGFNDSILEIARLERGDYELIPEETTFRSVMEEACGNLKENILMKNVRVEIKTHTEEKIRQDRSLLVRILRALLENAVQHSPRGETVHVEFKLNMDGEKGRLAAFSVSDNGPGVEPEYMEHIFRPFVKLSARGRLSGDGPGLGLSIAAFAAGALGGRVNAISNNRGDGERSGTIFVLSVPFVHPSCSPEAKGSGECA